MIRPLPHGKEAYARQIAADVSSNRMENPSLLRAVQAKDRESQLCKILDGAFHPDVGRSLPAGSRVAAQTEAASARLRLMLY
jgi:hypothetical protein